MISRKITVNHNEKKYEIKLLIDDDVLNYSILKDFIISEVVRELCGDAYTYMTRNGNTIEVRYYNDNMALTIDDEELLTEGE